MKGVSQNVDASEYQDRTASTYSVEPPRARRSARILFFVYIAVTLGVLVFLLWPSRESTDSGPDRPASLQEPPVRLSNEGNILIRADSPLRKKLQIAGVKPNEISAPVVTVTGTVVASLEATRAAARDWQFDSPDLLTAYTDWQKAIAEIGFARAQLSSMQQLVENRVAAQGAVVERLEKLVESGTETERDLATAHTDLLEAQIQGRKDVHEAQTSWRLAQKSEAALSHQLQQAGLDPALLSAAAAGIDIVIADVPETLSSRVKVGQGCEARFVGVVGRRFSGTVQSIAPVLSSERRSLRVLFTISDAEDQLRPGMFADIGLGTDAREALLAPIAGIVHVGRSDYLLVSDGDDEWRVAEVQVGELHGEEVEVLDGLRAGDQVVGQGAILLKPFVIEATQQVRPHGAGGA
jgi:hypothetical protein